MVDTEVEVDRIVGDSTTAHDSHSGPDAARTRVLVIGAGLSGSLVVRALAACGARGPVVLADAREQPTRGRFWASWEPRTAPPAGARSFERLRVAGAKGEVILQLQDHRYVVIDGDELQVLTDAALARLDGRRRTTTVTAIRTGEHRPEVATRDGVITADVVLDSVGLGDTTTHTPRAWLHFTGWRVRCDSAAFDADTVTLMDLRVPQRRCVRFVYVLPESDRSALVEMTTFSSTPDPIDDADDLVEHLDTMTAGSAWSVTGRERGSLALVPWRRRVGDGQYLTIGTAAGLVKASTGYGARLMSMDATAVARAIVAGRPPRGAFRRPRRAWMDDVFLQLAITEPDAVVNALESLFAKNPPDRVVRFLNEESTLIEEVRILRSLPASPFLRAAWRGLREKTRR